MNIRWLWLQKTDTTRPWAGLPLEYDKQTKAMFEASIQIVPGKGNRTIFWSDRWLNSTSLMDIGPDLCNAVTANTRKNRTLQQALQGDQWIRDITGSITVLVLVQYLKV